VSKGFTKYPFENTNYGVPAITYVNDRSEGYFFVFTREKDSLLEIRMSTNNGSSWDIVPHNEFVRPWCFKSGFSAVSRQDNQFDVIGIDYFNNVMHLSFTDQQWNNWAQVGAGICFNGTPVLSKMNENRMDAFAIGNNNTVYHNTWLKGATGSGSWASWTAISESFGVACVAAASSSPTSCDIFALGYDTKNDGKIRIRRLSVNPTTNASSLSQSWTLINAEKTILFNMSAISPSRDKITLFAIDKELNIVQCKLTGVNSSGSWSTVAPPDISVTGRTEAFLYGVDAIAHQPDKITIIAGYTNSVLKRLANWP